MEYEVTILFKVDPSANFLGSDTRYYEEDLEDHITSVFYDVDDVTILEITTQEM